MFGQLGWGEILVIALVGLIVLGPERLPHYAREAGKMLRNLRTMANNATNEIKNELGPELADLDVRDLHPKAMLRKYMDAEDAQDAAKDSSSAHAHLSWANPPSPEEAESADGTNGTNGLPQPAASKLDDIT